VGRGANTSMQLRSVAQQSRVAQEKRCPLLLQWQNPEDTCTTERGRRMRAGERNNAYAKVQQAG
jgi:hypothetical protein